MSYVERDNRLDSLRGYLLVVMTVDHLRGPLARYTNETFGYVSALEGFVFLSGLMLAAVYWDDSASPRRLLRRVGRRILRIYVYQLALLACLALLTLSAVHRVALEPWVQPYFSAPGVYFAWMLLLIHQPVYFDILPIYLGFVVISPLILFAFRRGWAAPILVGSGLAWVAGQRYSPLASIAGVFCDTCRQGPVRQLAWQLIWIAGLYVGFRTGARRPVLAPRSPYLVAACAATGAFLFLARHQFVRAGIDLRQAVDVGRLAWLRLLNFTVLGVIVSSLLQGVAKHRSIPWLALLGRASLAVFAYHVIVVYALLPYLPRVAARGALIYSLFTVAVVTSLTLPAWASRRYRLLFPHHTAEVPEQPLLIAG